MARIAGVDIPKQKRGVIALTYIFGVGRSRAKEILDSGEYFQEVRSEQNALQQMGITSVPTFIINDQYALTGGQPSDAFVQAFKQIAEQEAQ